MTRPLARKRRTIPTFTEKRWLLSGKPFALPFLESGRWAQRLWREFGKMITERHIAKHPGSRPWGWWKYDAPQPRNSSAESQLQYLRRHSLLTEEEKERVPHVRPRLRRSTEPLPASHPLSPLGTVTAPAAPYHPLARKAQFVLDDETGRVEFVRAGTR